jgi:hypothetical protein
LNGFRLLVGRSIVEDRIHHILEHGDIGWLRNVQRTRTLRSQSLATKMDVFIRWTGRHVGNTRRIIAGIYNVEGWRATGIGIFDAMS